MIPDATKLARLVPVLLALLPEVATAQEAEPATGSATTPAPTGRPPGEPRAIAGLAGVTTISTVVFASQPDSEYRFEANYIFPARVRWELSFGGEHRSVDHRYGDRFFRTPFGSTTSEELGGPDRATAARRMELRRALLLYPHGFEWSGDGAERTTTLLAPGDAPPAGVPLGTIAVRLDDDGRPLHATARLPDGTAEDRLEVTGWTTEYERDWPSGLELSVAGEAIWTETTTEVDVARRYLDLFFVPIDRREQVSLRPGTQVLELEVPPLLVRATPLDPETDWPTAMRNARDELARERASGDRALEDVARIGVSADGRPESVLLAAVEPVEALSAPWIRLRSTRAVTLLLDDPTQVSASVVRRLFAAIPAGHEPEVGYVRPVGDDGLVQLVLRFVPRASDDGPPRDD